MQLRMLTLKVSSLNCCPSTLVLMVLVLVFAGFWRDNGDGLLRYDVGSWAMQFDRVENSFFLQCQHGHFLTRSDPCTPVLASEREAAGASRALCPHHCWRCILWPRAPLTLAPHCSHVKVSCGCCSGSHRSAFVAYESNMWIFVAGTANSHFHHCCSLEGVSRRRSIHRVCAVVLAAMKVGSSSSRASHSAARRASRLPETDVQSAKAAPAPFQTSIAQTPLLSWLHQHLYACPLGARPQKSHFFAQSHLRTCSVDVTVCTPSLFRRSCVRSRDT